jgi:prophage antirepressor-like protein
VTELIPFDFRGTSVRVVTIDGQPWFIAADVTFVLGYSNGRDAVDKHVRPHQRAAVAIHDGSQNRQMTVISEGGLYRLMLRANTVLADEFQDWVTDEVLPTVRTTGTYTVRHALPQSFAEALRELASTVEAKELAEARAAELEPAAKSWTALADAGGDYALRDAAQILDRDPSISTGQNRLSRYLRQVGWTDGSGQPYQKHVDVGRIVRRATAGYTDPLTGGHVATWQVRITAKGLHELHRLLGGTGPLLLAA